MKKGFIAFVISTMLFCAAIVPGQAFADSAAPEVYLGGGVITPNYIYISSISSNLSITKGVATCFGQIITGYSYDVDLTVNLQQYKNGAWKTLRTWTAAGYGIRGATINKDYNVVSGYKYRVQVIGRVLSSSGKQLDRAVSYYECNYQ